jgi:hypothetical protein
VRQGDGRRTAKRSMLGTRQRDRVKSHSNKLSNAFSTLRYLQGTIAYPNYLHQPIKIFRCRALLGTCIQLHTTRRFRQTRNNLSAAGSCLVVVQRERVPRVDLVRNCRNRRGRCPHCLEGASQGCSLNGRVNRRRIWVYWRNGVICRCRGSERCSRRGSSGLIKRRRDVYW